MTDSPPPVIAIDGPSGSGKSSLAAALGQRLGWHVLDSGAIYRTLAQQLNARGERDDDAGALAAGLAGRFSFVDARLALDGKPLGMEIRLEAVTARAARLAGVAEVRRALLDVQRAFRVPPGLVAEGRDIGSVVFPDAVVKLFLDAGSDTRADRRSEQLRGSGAEALSRSETLASMRERDARDRRRAAAPLRRTADMVSIDNTALSFDELVQRAWQQVLRWRAASGQSA